MTKYLLTDWEINGYDDSDFMLTYWDDVEKKVYAHCYASTRYGGCMCKPEPIEGGSSYHLCGNAARADRPIPEVLLCPTTEKVEEARVWLEGYIFDRMVIEDQRLVNEPDVPHLHAGLEVRLLEDCRYHAVITEPCNKCAGSGKWVNPRKPEDKRDCFGCKGTGQHVTSKAKDAKGKQVWGRLTAGIHGVVVDWRSFGQFYANGYNKPDRHNTTVQFRLDDGPVVRANLSKLRLRREYRKEEELRGKARSLSYSYGFSGIYPKHAWDTHNFAARVGAPNPSSHPDE